MSGRILTRCVVYLLETLPNLKVSSVSICQQFQYTLQLFMVDWAAADYFGIRCPRILLDIMWYEGQYLLHYLIPICLTSMIAFERCYAWDRFANMSYKKRFSSSNNPISAPSMVIRGRNGWVPYLFLKRVSDLSFENEASTSLLAKAQVQWFDDLWNTQLRNSVRVPYISLNMVFKVSVLAEDIRTRGLIPPIFSPRCDLHLVSLLDVANVLSNIVSTATWIKWIS